MKLAAVFVIVLFQQSWARYTPDWPSLDARPLPSWYDDAKVGVFLVAGPYAVPGVESEWFWDYWKTNSSSEAALFMKKNYPPNFTYQDFGPKYTMSMFNPKDYADLIELSGAKYVVYTAKFHDGYATFPSRYSFGWNSVEVGPKRNILKDLKMALKAKQDIQFGVYYSLYEWYNPLYLQDKNNSFRTRDFPTTKMLPEMKQIVTELKPDIWWSDGDWDASADYFGSKEFLAWLYNDSPVKDSVVVNDRWGNECPMKHGGFWSGADRWKPGKLIAHKWESAFTLDRLSWGFRRNINIEDILTIEETIAQIVKTISFNGNALFSVGPRADGMIAPIFQERFRQIGSWLRINGEAIYKTRPWKYQRDSVSPNVWYTRSKYGSFVYGISLGWPRNDVMRIGRLPAQDVSRVQLLGYNNDTQPVKFRQNGNVLEVLFPDLDFYQTICQLETSATKYSCGCNWGYTIKFTLKDLAAFENVQVDVLNR